MTPNPPKLVHLDVFGEGVTDLGTTYDLAVPPVEGVVPILVSALCWRPPNLRVKCKPLQFLQGKGTRQKAKFAKRQSYYNGSNGAALVVDTEGDRKRVLRDVTAGRDSLLPAYPMAVGVAHTCIETWLLVDAVAIALALGRTTPPALPAAPESLSAPRQDPTNNPKVALAACADPPQKDLSAATKWEIARQISDLAAVRRACPNFDAFAQEVDARIQPLFTPTGPAKP